MVKKIIKKPFSIIKNYYLDRRATKYLKKVSKKRHSSDKPMKVGFIVFEPETWDKLDGVYKELKKRTNIITEIVVVPSFDRDLKLTTEYGNELEFFKNIDDNCIQAYYDGSWIDISIRELDFVFFQDPYNAHMPPELRSDKLVQISKICYIPYGFSGSDVFGNGSTNSDFFRNVSYAFMDTVAFNSILMKKYKKSVKKGLQHFKMLGYPAFSDYFSDELEIRDIKNVLWTPRWSYDPIVGGSHFIEYMYEYLKFGDKYPNINFVLRPHPMMFSNFINSGILTQKQVDEYIIEARNHNVNLSVIGDLREEFNNADILITDYSSIIPLFFFTGKPIVYCNSSIPFNAEFQKISEGMYMTDNWEEIDSIMEKLVTGEHVLRETQRNVTKDFKSIHQGAAKKIVDYLVKEYDKGEI